MPQSDSGSKIGKKGKSWSTDNSAKLYNCFRERLVDPTKQDPAYIKTVWEANEWIRLIYPIGPKNFYRTYRNHASVFLSEEKFKGARRGKF